MHVLWLLCRVDKVVLQLERLGDCATLQCRGPLLPGVNGRCHRAEGGRRRQNVSPAFHNMQCLVTLHCGSDIATRCTFDIVIPAICQPHITPLKSAVTWGRTSMASSPRRPPRWWCRATPARQSQAARQTSCRQPPQRWRPPSASCGPGGRSQTWQSRCRRCELAASHAVERVDWQR